MKVLIHSKFVSAFIPQDIDVCRVELKAPQVNFDTLKMFSCFNCKCGLIQYNGRVINIAWGIKEQRRVPFVLQCPSCKQKYLFSEIIEEVF